MNIEIISGSPREQSITFRLALHIKKQLQQSYNNNAGIIDVRDWNLGNLQTVFSSVEKTPQNLQPLAKRIFDADAFILVSPEYNGSYTAALQNLLDHFPKQTHKVFGIATASTGALGGTRATQQLLLLVSALFGIASPQLLITPQVDKKFGADGNLTDESFAKNVNLFLQEFLWLATKVSEKK
jgi:NAD(P)H-dependent FMN reductase